MHFWQQLRLQPGQKAAIITHAGVIRLILAAVNNIPLASCFEIEVSYGGIYYIQEPQLHLMATS
jgi:alpha-ribazole phosphatase